MIKQFDFLCEDDKHEISDLADMQISEQRFSFDFNVHSLKQYQHKV